jgi:hypothetical protein
MPTSVIRRGALSHGIEPKVSFGSRPCENLAATQLLAKDHRARAVSPMELKHGLGEIEADGADLVHGRLLEWL